MGGDEGLYTPADLARVGFDPARDLGAPGEFPFTRGIYPTMYRGRLWTMRQYAGFSTAEETSRRFRYMLERGLAGINIAFDLPTQHGYDSDHPRARGEVGKVGVPVSSLRDMEVLFDGIPLEQASPANAINAPAAVILAMYVALAERQGLPLDRLTGSTQNDILKEFIARGTYIFPPVPSLRLVTDIIEFCADRLPRWNFINVCGYHMREAGSTLVQEVGFALADAITYVQAAVDRGVGVDRFAPRFAFNFTAGTELLVEAAKFRAMRRLWARVMRERFGATRPASWAFRTGAGSGASQLTAQQPMNNVVRVTLNSIAAVLGGAQSLHTAAYDEALALPTEDAARIALRTQQIVGFESGVANTIDPFAGSYYVELLTNQIEEGARELLTRIESVGGTLAAIEQGYIQRQVQESAYKAQLAVDAGDAIVVGVNKYTTDERSSIEVFQVDPELEVQQVHRVQKVRASRDAGRCRASLDSVRSAAGSADNLVPPIIAAVEARATVGEIADTLRSVFGEYREVSLD